MADLDRAQGQGVPLSMVSKYVDMGDGTHALQVAVASGGTVTIPVTGPLTDAELRATDVPVDVVSSSGSSIIIPVLLGGGAYIAGDALGGIMEFPLVSRETGRGVVLTNLIIADLTVQQPAIEVWFFNQTFTPSVDNAAFTILDADLPNVVAVVSTADLGGAWFAAADNSIARIEFVQCVEPNVRSLFAQMVVRAGATYAVGDITVRPNYLQD